MLAKTSLTSKLIRGVKRCLSYQSYHASSVDDDDNFYLSKDFVRSRGNHYMYDPDVAAEIASVVKKESDNVDTMIEINPGVGVLSKEFVKLYNRLILIEKKKQFLPSLQKLKDIHKNIEFGQDKTDFFEFDKTGSFYFLRPPSVLDLIPKSSNGTDIVANIFVIVPPLLERFFVKTLNHSSFPMDGIFGHGRINFFAVVPPSFLMRINYVSVNFSLAVKFELEHFMEYKYLMEIDFNSVAPKFPKTFEKKYNSKAHVIKLTPKSDMDQILSVEELDMYRQFSKQMLISPQKRVILRMEDFFPNCGIYLIDNGFHMMQKFQDLTSEEFLKLFKCIPNIPDFKYSLWRQFLISEGLLPDDDMD